MRSSFSGTLAIGLTRVGLKAYSVAVDEPEDNTIHWLHRPCKARLIQGYTCGTCGNPVPKDEQVRGIEHEGQWLLFEESEWATLASPSNAEWALSTMVPLSKIHPLWTHRYYYLVPTTTEDVRLYMLFAQVFAARQEGALVTFVTRRHTRLGVIRPDPPGLQLQVLRFAESIRSPAEYGITTTPLALTRTALRLAETLLNTPGLRHPFQYESYLDPTHERLEKQIRAKLRGKPLKPIPPAPMPEKSPSAVSLVQLLEQSIAKTKTHRKK